MTTLQEVEKRNRIMGSQVQEEMCKVITPFLARLIEIVEKHNEEQQPLKTIG